MAFQTTASNAMTAAWRLRTAGDADVHHRVGFGLPCLWAIWRLRTTGEVPIFLGFETYRGGPFERHGIQTTVSLLVAFAVVCAFEAVAGWRVWFGRRDGGILASALLPVEAVFWWGFALPVPPLFAVVRSVLLIAWRGSGDSARQTARARQEGSS